MSATLEPIENSVLGQAANFWDPLISAIFTEENFGIQCEHFIGHSSVAILTLAIPKTENLCKVLLC